MTLQKRLDVSEAFCCVVQVLHTLKRIRVLDVDGLAATRMVNNGAAINALPDLRSLALRTEYMGTRLVDIVIGR